MIKIKYQKSLENNKDFLQYLLEYIKEFGYQYVISLGDDKFITMNEYINTMIKNVFIKQLNSKQVLIQGLGNLVLRETPQEYFIEIDYNQKIPNTYISIKDVVQFIEDGNLEISGLKVFNKILTEFQYGFPLYRKVFQNWSLLDGSKVL